MLSVPFPKLPTPRLNLGAFLPAHGPSLHTLAADKDVAGTLVQMPHPYTRAMADAWIAGHAEAHANGRFNFAITEQANAGFVGAVTLKTTAEHRCAEVAYWIGKPFWGRGYATEAVQAAIAHGFTALGINRIYGLCFADNLASGRVLIKVGLLPEGVMRQHVCKFGVFHDVRIYGLVAAAYRGPAS